MSQSESDSSNVPATVLPAQRFAELIALTPNALTLSEAQAKQFVELLAQHPDVNALMQQSANFASLVPQTFVVTTSEQYEANADALQQVKGIASRMEAVRMTFTRPLDAMKKTLMDYFRAAHLPAVEASYKEGMIAFQTAEELKRQEEQLAADVAARHLQEKLERDAAKASASGKVERAALLEERAAAVVPIISQRAAPKVSGIHTNEVWTYEVVDPALVPRAFLMIDEAKLAKYAKAMKGDSAAEGVRFFAKKQMASARA